MSSRTPRPYQTEAMAAVRKEWETQTSTLLVLATGLGKTFTAVRVALERAGAGGRILWLAHRGELLDQAAETFEDVGLKWELEKAESKASRIAGLYGARPVVVGSVMSMRGDRLYEWDKNGFDTIVVDEAHRAVAQSYRDILEHFDGAKVLGLTATPDRADTVGLHNVFDSCAFEYNMRDGITDGYLAPLAQKQVMVDDLDLSRIKTVAGDLKQSELEEAMIDGGALHQIAKPLAEESGDRKTLVFTVSVAHAENLAAVLSNYVDPRSVRWVSGGTPKDIRKEIVHEFREGDVQYLINCEVFTEGFDAPQTACIACARPTKSRALYTQMVGRGTRLWAGDGTSADKFEEWHAKQDCLILDFVGNSGKHRLINPMDVLAGEILEPEIMHAAMDFSLDGAPTLEALQRAEAFAEEKARRELERRVKAKKIRADATWQTLNRDPFGLLGVKRQPYGPHASDKQLAFLRNLMKTDKLPEGLSSKEASSLIGSLLRAQRQKLGTYKMRRQLAKAGLNPDLPMEDAKKVMSYLAQHRWPHRNQIPQSMRDKYGLHAE